MGLKLVVEGFKSIRHATLELRPVTILIGPPDSGKSNTLEALGLLSYISYGGDVRRYFRWDSLAALSHSMSQAISGVELKSNGESIIASRLLFETGSVKAEVKLGEGPLTMIEYSYEGDVRAWSLAPGSYEALQSLLRVRFYRYTPVSLAWKSAGNGFVLSRILEGDPGLYDELLDNLLLPPNGGNLTRLVRSNTEAADLVKSFLTGWLGYDDVVITRIPTPRGPPVESITAILAEKGIRTSIPLSLLSDGAIQYLMVALSLTTRPPNRIPRGVPDIVALEEPEAHAFPYLVNAIAEEIIGATREGVYVMLSTHNPYLLIRLIEKTPKDSLAVYYVYYSRAKASSVYVMLLDEHLEELLEEEYASLYTIEDILEDSGVILK
ncbi:MAG: ATP-binding protein [Desulfurococcales archaeon]|nr:ATP-binding protein [Desulfurococcales archaeon]